MKFTTAEQLSFVRLLMCPDKCSFLFGIIGLPWHRRSWNGAIQNVIGKSNLKLITANNFFWILSNATHVALVRKKAILRFKYTEGILLKILKVFFCRFNSHSSFIRCVWGCIQETRSHSSSVEIHFHFVRFFTGDCIFWWRTFASKRIQFNSEDDPDNLSDRASSIVVHCTSCFSWLTISVPLFIAACISQSTCVIKLFGQTSFFIMIQVLGWTYVAVDNRFNHLYAYGISHFVDRICEFQKA